MKQLCMILILACGACLMAKPAAGAVLKSDQSSLNTESIMLHIEQEKEAPKKAKKAKKVDRVDDLEAEIDNDELLQAGPI